MLNVSADSVKKAAKVLKDGDEQLVDAVSSGQVSLAAGAAVAKLPKKEQRQVVKKGEVKEAAKKIREKKKATSKTSSKRAKGAKETPSGADDAQTPTGTAKEATVAVQPEPPPSEKASPGTVTGASSRLAAADDFPLRRQAHDGLDAMVAAGLRVGNRARVEKSLRMVCIFLAKTIGELEGGVAP